MGQASWDARQQDRTRLRDATAGLRAKAMNFWIIIVFKLLALIGAAGVTGSSR
jgi:hypothetical protein